MNAKKLHYLLITSVVCALLGSAIAVWYASNWLSDHAQDLVSKKLEGVALEEQQLRSLEAKSALTDYDDLQTILSQVAPDTKEQEKVIAELYKIAGENNIQIQSLVFPASELGDKQPTATTQTQTDASTNDNNPGAATQAPASSSSSITQTEKIKGLSGVVGLRIQPSGFIEVDGNGNVRGNGLSYDTVLNFLESFERNRRQFIIDQIAITPIIEEGTATVVGYNLSLSLTALIAT